MILRKGVAAVRRKPMIYQNIVVDGKEYGPKARLGSAFFNEGKWKNFIEPFLPENCRDMVFMEFGCNCGLFLKMAQERGFAKTLGIEANTRLRDITAKYLGRTDQVIYNGVTEPDIYRDTFIADLPAADFVLMANFHYHLHLPVFVHLINLLRCKTRYLILVSVEDASSRLFHRPMCGIEAARKYFRAWSEAGCISGISAEGDPWPRESMYSVLFKTDVERVPIQDLSWSKYGIRKYREHREKMMASGERRPMTYPCILRPDGEICDGKHRLITQEEEGATTLLVEKMF